MSPLVCNQKKTWADTEIDKLSLSKKTEHVKDGNAKSESEHDDDEEHKARCWIPETNLVGRRIKVKGNNKADSLKLTHGCLCYSPQNTSSHQTKTKSKRIEQVTSSTRAVLLSDSAKHKNNAQINSQYVPVCLFLPVMFFSVCFS